MARIRARGAARRTASIAWSPPGPVRTDHSRLGVRDLLIGRACLDHRLERSSAAFAPPVADAGDNRSAGPIMELVIHYWPNHYMALYHAGMAQYATGQEQLARKNLRAFLSYYHENDGWTQSARETLVKLGVTP